MIKRYVRRHRAGSDETYLPDKLMTLYMFAYTEMKHSGPSIPFERAV